MPHALQLSFLSMNTSLLIGYASILSVLVPLGFAIVQWNKIPSDISTLRWLLIVGLVSDVLGSILGSFAINNLWVGDVFMFIQFTILLYIFSRQFQRKLPFVVVYLIIVLFYSFAYPFGNQAMVTLVRSNAVDGLLLVIISIAFFYKLLNELKVTNIQRLPILWISFATLFYYSGNFFVFLASGYLEQDPDTFILFWMLHNVLNVIKNILFAIGLWQSYRTMRS